jgi:iron complex transport system substrate-binding protein
VSTSRPRALAALLVPLAALALTACGSSSAETSGTTGDAASSAGATVPHAFGETEVPADPQRVVTWGWGSTDAVLALGEVPVAIPLATYGADEEGVLPWVAEELDALGAETPVQLSEADGVPFEQIAAQQPDLILAVYSGITAEDYETLSQIAPTVAYPDQAWSTPWRDVVRTVGTALGVPEEAAHPELEGVTVAAVADTADAFYVYEEADPRVQFLTDLGMEVAPSVSELSTGESTFFYTLSPELVGGLTSDVLLSYADTPEQAEEFLAKPYAATLPQVDAGAVASIVGTDVVASVSPPTALSLPWGLDTYVEELSAAAQNAR